MPGGGAADPGTLDAWLLEAEPVAGDSWECPVKSFRRRRIGDFEVSVGLFSFGSGSVSKGEVISQM